MSLSTKVAVSVLGLGGASVVGCYAGGILKFGGEEEKSKQKDTITWISLSKDTDFTNTYNTDTKVGKKYGKYLVSSKQANNQKWWEKTYKQYEEDKRNKSNELSAEFGDGKVTSGYSSNEEGSQALNVVCKSIYTQEANSINFDTGNDNQHRLAKNLLKYCSPLGIVPVILGTSDSYDTGTVGKDHGANKKLVSTKNEENKGFWEAQQKWLEDSENRTLDTYFAQFFEGDDSSKKLKKDKGIKEICEQAYEVTHQESPTTSSPKADDVVKYCSFPIETTTA